MKIRIFALLFLLLLKPLASRAQYDPLFQQGSWYRTIIGNEEREKEKNKAAQLKQKKIMGLEHGPRNVTYEYDTAGHVVRSLHGNKLDVQTFYGANDRKAAIRCYSKGKLIETDSFRWEEKHLKEYDAYDDKAELFERQQYEYDSLGLMKYTYMKRRHGKMKELRRTEYEYYPDKTYKKITYFKKGKPSYYTVFDCNPAGQNHKVKSDSAYNCVKYEVDSLGNKLKITITNQKSYSWKVIEYYNNKEEIIARKTFDLHKNGELVWAYFFKPGKQTFQKFISYHRKKEFYRIENEYDEKDQPIVVRTYSKGKLKSKITHSYNDRGLVTVSERSGKNGRKKGQTIYSYEYY